MELQKPEIEINKVLKQKIDDAKGIACCKNYIGSFFEDSINIFELTENLDIQLKSSLSTEWPITNIDFNYKYKDILLSCSSYDYIKLYNISAQNNFEIISTLHGLNSKGTHYAKFNPTKENLIISSKGKIIDIWDVTKYTNIKSITTQKSVYKLAWNITGNFFGYINRTEGLNIRDKENIIFSICANDLKNFEFRKNEDIITFHFKDVIKIWDTRKYSQPKFEFKDLPLSYELYDKNNDYLYIKNNKLFQIYECQNFELVHKEDIECDNNTLLLLDTCFLKNNEIANLFELEKSGDCNIIKIINKNKTSLTSEQIIEKDIQYSNDFINNIVYNISDYTKFLNYIKTKKDPDYPCKNYILISEIKKELNDIKYELLLDRKKYVEEQINKNQSFKDIYEEYIYYIKLIIRDNTNKKLLKKYLHFLEKNETKLEEKIPNLDKYENEVEFYKVCFDKEEYKVFKRTLTKDKSEKEKLIEFLTKFKNSDIEQFKQLTTKIKCISEYPYFNQPITEENEELLFFKIKLILYYAISNFDYTNPDDGKNKFNSQKKIIKEILKKKYLENDNIIKNTNKLSWLISLINEPDNDEINEYILNLLDPNTNIENDINEINKELIKKENEMLLSEINLINENPKNICKNNLIEYLHKDKTKIIKTNIDLFSYDKLLEERQKEINLNKIKNFLKDILKRNIFKLIFNILYKNEEVEIIKQDSFIDDYVDNHLFLIPYKSNNYCGITDRFSCNSYIFYDSDISYITKVNIDDKVKYALKTSRFIAVTLHEFNHYIYSYLLHLNNYIELSFDSQRKKELIINEGGLIMELILFGEEITKINLEQSIFILDEKNYEKTEKQFQKEFIKAKGGNLYIKGTHYSQFNNDIINQKYFEKIRSIAIKAKVKKLDKFKEIYKRRNNCVLGRNLSLYSSD